MMSSISNLTNQNVCLHMAWEQLQLRCFTERCLRDEAFPLYVQNRTSIHALTGFRWPNVQMSIIRGSLFSFFAQIFICALIRAFESIDYFNSIFDIFEKIVFSAVYQLASGHTFTPVYISQDSLYKIYIINTIIFKYSMWQQKKLVHLIFYRKRDTISKLKWNWHWRFTVYVFI